MFDTVLYYPLKLYLILLIFVFGVSNTATSQALDSIPNGGFEHWEGQQNCQYYIPKPWENYCTDYTGFVFKTFPPSPFPPYKDTAMLYLQSGLSTNPNFVEQTFVLQSRPKSYYMLAGYQGSKIAGFNVIILLMKGKDTIAYNSESSDPQAYRYIGDTVIPFQFVFPITYRSILVPDYCYIRLNSASKVYKNYSNGGGTLYADDIKFLDTVMEKNVYHPDTSQKDTTQHNAVWGAEQDYTKLQVYPNPSQGQVTFSFVTIKTGEHILYIYDVSGKLVSAPINKNIYAGYEAQLNWQCPDCNSGMYTYKLVSPEGISQGKLILIR